MSRSELQAHDADQEIREALKGPDHAYELPQERAWLASEEVEGGGVKAESR